MKKIIALLLGTTMICSLAACGSSSSATTTTAAATTEAATTEAVTTEAESEDEGAAVVGGWTITTDEFTGMLDDDAQKAFDTATESYTGMEFEPIALLGTQVVAGTNYMILCRGTTVTATPEAGLKIVVIYADLSGNAEITNVADLDLGALEESEEEASTEQLAGGWTAAELPVADIDADAEKALEEATEGLTGATYEPCAVLGTKVTNGTEYAILCGKTLVTAEPVYGISVLFVNAGATGENTLVNIADIVLENYSGN